LLSWHARPSRGTGTSPSEAIAQVAPSSSSSARLVRSGSRRLVLDQQVTGVS
jgi:hypothetical protein